MKQTKKKTKRQKITECRIGNKIKKRKKKGGALNAHTFFSWLSKQS